jgi:hypothetical protein
MLETVVIAVSMAFLALASAADLKTGEVPERWSTGLAVFILAVSAAHAVLLWDVRYLYQPILWGLAAFAASYGIFYLGQWGGGDVKLLGGIGGLLGFLDAGGFGWPNAQFLGFPVPPLATYAIDMATMATPYVVIYTLAMGVGKPRVFMDYLAKLSQPRTAATVAATVLPLAAAVYLGLDILAYVYAFVPFLALASVYMKTVEEKLMTKSVGVSELREWDIIVEDVVADGERAVPGGSIEGITPAQLSMIRDLAAAGKIPQTIRTKWGVKFAPVLMLSVPATIYFGNILDIVFMRLVRLG